MTKRSFGSGCASAQDDTDMWVKYLVTLAVYSTSK